MIEYVCQSELRNIYIYPISTGPPGSFTNKAARHDINEILLKAYSRSN